MVSAAKLWDLLVFLQYMEKVKFQKVSEGSGFQPSGGTGGWRLHEGPQKVKFTEQLAVNALSADP